MKHLKRKASVAVTGRHINWTSLQNALFTNLTPFSVREKNAELPLPSTQTSERPGHTLSTQLQKK